MLVTGELRRQGWWRHSCSLGFPVWPSIHCANPDQGRSQYICHHQQVLHFIDAYVLLWRVNDLPLGASLLYTAPANAATLQQFSCWQLQARTKLSRMRMGSLQVIHLPSVHLPPLMMGSLQSTTPPLATGWLPLSPSSSWEHRPTSGEKSIKMKKISHTN